MKKIVSILLTISLCITAFFTIPNINSKSSVNFFQNSIVSLSKIYYEYTPNTLSLPEGGEDAH